MTRLILVVAALVCSLQLSAQSSTLRTGKHSLTLQWISWDEPGSAQITKASNGYRIQGQQRSGDGRDYLTIDGTLRVETRKKLLFSGKIVTSVNHIRNGEPCVREGDYVFLSTGKRRYWRLQQMLNCDGEVTDYVDVYF